MFRSTWISSTAIVLALACVVAAQPAAPAPATAPTQDQLLGVLRSDADLPAKWDAARLLARTANGSAAPALAQMLGDEKRADLARWALEAMPAPAADDALRLALPTLKGKLLVGVILSIGARRDAGALEPLTKLLGDSDAQVAAAAAFALGRLAIAPAAAALAQAETGAAAPVQATIRDALLRTAESLPAQDALAIYDRLRDANMPPAVRMSALRGAIVARSPADGAALILNILAGGDGLEVNVALRTATHELAGPEVTRMLAAGLDKLPADRQAPLVAVLGNREDVAALPKLLVLAKSGPKPLRIAAFASLARLASPDATAVLADAATDADAEIAAPAQDALVSLPGTQAEDAILAMLAGDDARRQLGIALVYRRCLTRAVPALLTLAQTGPPAARLAAIKAVGELAGDAQLPALLDLLATAKDQAQRDSVERILALLLARSQAAQTGVDLCVARYAQAQGETKPALLRVLRATGSPKALQLVRAALTDPALQDTAIRCLTAWPDASAATDLLALANSAPQANYRMLAFRGLLRLADQDKGNPKAQLELIAQARQVAATPEMRKLVLGSLADVNAVQALQIALTCAKDDAPTRPEAAQAALRIGEALAQKHPAPVRAAMKDLAPLVSDASVREQIQAVLDLAASAPVNMRQFLESDPARSQATAKALAAKAPKGYHLAWYLDCGPDTQAGEKAGPRVRVTQGRSHIWAGSPGRNAPRYFTATFWEQKVIFDLAGLTPTKTYRLGLAWWDVDNGTRKESVYALTGSGQKPAMIVPPTALPFWVGARQGPQELTAAIPPGLYPDGSLKIEFRDEGKPNVVVCELWLWESD